MNKLILTLVACATTLAGSAFAAENPIATRKATMQNVVAATKLGGAMLKGQMEYSPIAGQLVLRVMNTAALGVGEHFPKGSDTGGETTASPKIWQDMAGFKAALAKFQADTAASLVKPEEVEFFEKADFGAAFGKATANCKACHQEYRVKKN
jgi:cytochrome c556